MLTPDDISPGQYITVLQNLFPNGSFNQGNIFGSLFNSETIVAIKNEENRSFYGEILKVKAVNLPYVVLEAQTGFQKGNTVVKDIRNTKFILVSKKYRNALLKKTI